MPKVIHDQGCADCVEHPMGICWRHKMEHMRSKPSTGLVVPKAFKNDQTNREFRDEIYAAARASGRDIQRAK